MFCACVLFVNASSGNVRARSIAAPTIANATLKARYMCEHSGCSREIPWWVEPAVIDGKNFCRLCAEMNRLGFNSYEEYLAHVNAKHEEYLATLKKQQEQLKEMYR